MEGERRDEKSKQANEQYNGCGISLVFLHKGTVAECSDVRMAAS